MDLKCIVCNNATKLQCKCGVLYCSSECQKANWILHKSECVAMCKLRSHFDELSALVAKGGRSEASHLVNLAECYASGFGCVANKSRAVELFEEAATNHDDVGSMVRLGEMAESSDRKEAEKWFRSAANRDDPKGQLSLAELLLQNDQAVEARKWLRAASDAGEMQALSRLGYCLINGIGGDCDEKAGMSMMLEAAEKDAESSHNLGVILLEKKDEGGALRAFLKAAEQDCAPAQFNVGNCFLEGVGTERSLDKAIAWFERAAEEHGHARAMAQLGQIYSEHKKDQAKGYEYFLKAVKHGFTTDDL